MKILFASKHDISKEMLGDLLENHLKPKSGEQIEIDQRMVLWYSSSDEEEDNELNTEIWHDLREQYDIICGTFPPTSTISLSIARDESDREIRVFTPIAEVGRGCGGMKRIYNFLRWQEV